MSVFIRLYVEDAIRSGMAADMGAELWQTLCVLASFMDDRGECWPSQDYLAALLGVSRETANRRVRKLREYRWNGLPVIRVRRERDPETQQWGRTVYTILPAAGLAFGRVEKPCDV